MLRRLRIGFLLCCLTLGLASTKVLAQGFSARDLVRAQRNGQNTNLYGSNPYQDAEGEEGEEGAAEQTDSTKEKRIKKPLESYFFSDSVRALPNFRWNLSERYNRVEIIRMDTTLEDFRIDYPHLLEDVGNISQGALGQTSLPLNYFRRPQQFDFTFAQPFDAYTFTRENVPF
ncbi:MAG: hypothetical protein IIU62_02685, partial [Alistipes sp.]|nr:hypothetical protein [Alistipes sp.]